MLGEQHYQQDVLSALLKWTLRVGPLAAVVNLLGGIPDPAWTTPVGSGSVLVLSLVAWWCLKLIQQGRTQQAARIFLITGMCAMTLVVFIASKSEILLGAMGFSVFVIMATFFEPQLTAFRWGVVSIVFYEVGLAARLLFRARDLGLHIDEISLYTVPPIILIFFAIIGRIMTRYLIGALTESEAARHDLARSYAEVEQRVEERTHELVRERNRLDAALSELAVARDQAEAGSRAKSTFLSTMSHELRTPLTAILGYSTLVEREAQTLGHTNIVSDLSRITAAGQHLLELINDVLDLTNIEAAKVELDLEPCDLKALVDDVVGTIRPLAEKNLDTLHVDYLSDPGVRLLDQAKVRKILINLLSNAAKFTERGTITLSVAGDGDTDAGWITFRIADTGIGISSEHMQQLFHPFTKRDDTLKQLYAGTGLGLTICHRFCQLMGGDIAVTSAVGQGSTFTIRLPASVVPCSAAPVPSTDTAGNAQSPAPSGIG